MKPLALCGFGIGSPLAPWDDPRWEVWGCNAYVGPEYQLFRTKDGRFRADLWWQIHPLNTLSPGELAWFSRLPETRVPTLVLPEEREKILQAYPEIDQDLLGVFDMAPLRERFPRGIFASTFALQIAAALMLGYDTIRLYGADCTGLGRELSVERPAMHYWLGVAHGLNVDLQFVHPSTIGVYPHVYGVEFAAEARFAAALSDRIIPPAAYVLEDNANLNSLQQVEDFLATLR